MAIARIESHRDLLVWQKAMLLVEQACAMTRNFPDDEVIDW